MDWSSLFIPSGKQIDPTEAAKRFPGLVWQNGQAFTRGAAAPDPNDQYAYQQEGQSRGVQDADPNGPLVPADLSDPASFARTLAQFAGSTSAARGAASALTQAPAALAAQSAPSLGAPTLSSLPGMTMGTLPGATATAASAASAAAPMASSTSTLAKLFSSKSPLMDMAQQGLGALFGAKQQNAALDVQKEQQAYNREQAAQQQSRQDGASALAAGQMNPFTQQNMQARQALIGQLMSAYTPPAYDAEAHKWTGGKNIDPSIMKSIGQTFLSPTASAAATQAFGQNAGAAAPGFVMPSLSTMGYSPEVAGKSTGDQLQSFGAPRPAAQSLAASLTPGAPQAPQGLAARLAAKRQPAGF